MAAAVASRILHRHLVGRSGSELLTDLDFYKGRWLPDRKTSPGQGSRFTPFVATPLISSREGSSHQTCSPPWWGNVFGFKALRLTSVWKDIRFSRWLSSKTLPGPPERLLRRAATGS